MLELEKGVDKRERWNNTLEFAMTLLGLAAGYGSIWRFPYLIWKNGGGSFLIPYFICFVVFAVPQFYLEMALGQVYQKSPPKIFEALHPKFKGFGVFLILTSLSGSFYYNALLGYSIMYFFKSFSYPLPWSAGQSETFVAKNYFFKEVLKLTEDASQLGEFNGNIYACYVLGILLCYLCIQNGVKQTGKIAIYTATAPYFLLILLLLRGLLLEGAYQGLAYLFTIDYPSLFTVSIWFDAASQCLYQYSIGLGCIMLFGSYQERDQRILSLSLYVPLGVLFCGVLCALTVFIYMGYLAAQLNLDISQIPLEGPELTFIAYPTALALMPFSNFWSIMFFLMMITLGIDTQFALIETVAGAIEEEYQVPQRMNRLVICIGVCLIGILFSFGNGFYMMILADEYSQTIPLMSGVIFQTYFFAWYQDFEVLEADICSSIGQPTPILFVYFIKYTHIPILLLLVLLNLPTQILQSFSFSFFVFVYAWTYYYPYAVTYFLYQKNVDSLPSLTRSYTKMT